MKQLNYDNSSNYKELFDNHLDLYLSIESEGVDILNEKIPFGKYAGMKFIDILIQDSSYFNYFKNKLFNEQVSSSCNTYNHRVRMLRVMISVERYYIIERWGEIYEQGRNYPAVNFRHSAYATN
jgi:hypothetical protein